MSDIFAAPGQPLQPLLDAAQSGDCIHLAEGVYREKLLLKTPGLTIVGAGADRSVLIWDDYARKQDELGREYVTFRTWTLAVCADHVTMRNLAVVNDALFPETKGQEVALTVYGDDFLMEDCRLTSTQDTLFVGPLPPDLIVRYDGFLPDELRADKTCRQVFRSCLIEGTIDFIFGCGEARFETCEIRSLPDVRGVGYASAPSHCAWQTDGFLFDRCRFTCAEGVEAGSVYLARPWRNYGLARFENCSYAEHIAPVGFDHWANTTRERTCRFSETPPVPGRVKWMR